MNDFLRPCRIACLVAVTSWLVACVPATPASGGESIWNHNGSIMRWIGAGQERWVTYLDPRPGLWAVGVQPGTLLFRGRRIGNWMGGTAHIFSSGCAPVPYWVEGMVYSDAEVTLTGLAPLQDVATCAVLGHTWFGPNAVLRFVYIGR